jgi:TonB family protein
MRSPVIIGFAIASLLFGQLWISAALPVCDPKPKPLIVDIEVVGRESRVPHQGDVVVEVTVDLTGAASGPVIVSSTDTWFNQDVLDSAMKWRFTPPKQVCRLQMPVHFKLREDK